MILVDEEKYIVQIDGNYSIEKPIKQLKELNHLIEKMIVNEVEGNNLRIVFSFNNISTATKDYLITVLKKNNLINKKNKSTVFWFYSDLKLLKLGETISYESNVEFTFICNN